MKLSFLYLHIAIFLAGFTAALGYWIKLPALQLVIYRFLLSFIIISILFYKTIQKEIKIKNKRIFFWMFIGVVISIHWVLFFASVKAANVSIGVCCMALTGFFTSFTEPIITKKKFNILEIILGCITFLGICIIFHFHPKYKLGIIYGALSAIGSAIFPVLNKKEIDNGNNPKSIVAFSFLGGFIFLCLVNILQNKPFLYPQKTDWLPLLVLVVLCTVLAFILQLNALKHISAFTANLSFNLEPIYGVFIGLYILNESQELNTRFYLGVLLIISAVIWQTCVIVYKKRITQRKNLGNKVIN